MANGDAAQAAGMDLVPATSASAGQPGKVAMGYDTMNKTRDYIANYWNNAKSYAAGLFAAVPWANITGAPLSQSATANTIAQRDVNGKLTAGSPTSSGHLATKGYVDSGLDGRVNVDGDIMNGNLYLPNATGAVSSYVVAYLNSDGRVSRGVSARKYKKRIRLAKREQIDGVFSAPLREWQMKGGDGTFFLGYIADELAEHDDTERFVVRVNGEVESIDFIGFLLAQCANLHARVRDLEDRS